MIFKLPSNPNHSMILRSVSIQNSVFHMHIILRKSVHYKDPERFEIYCK